MLRKETASVFILVMSILIALRTPVLGYCPDSEVFFLGGFDCHLSHSHDHEEDHHHRDHSEPSPCEENHEMISFESEDFLWNASGDLGEAKMVLVGDAEFRSRTSLHFPRALTDVAFPSRPPPPDEPVFLRFSVLRL